MGIKLSIREPRDVLWEKVCVDTFKTFDNLSLLDHFGNLNLGFCFDMLEENFAIPFKELPNNLTRPYHTKTFNAFWNCICTARLKHGY